MSRRNKWLFGIWAIATVVTGVFSLDGEYTPSDDALAMLLTVGFVTFGFSGFMRGVAWLESRYQKQIDALMVQVSALAIIGALLFGFIFFFDKGAEIATDFAQDIFGSEPEGGWRCVERGQNMFSMSDSGELGAAEKGCTCEQMADFEYRVFGEVDFEALKDDHGCSF